MTFAARSSWKTGGAAPAPSGDLVMEINVTLDEDSLYSLYIGLNMYTGYTSDPLNVVVDWGDGSSNTYTVNDIYSHVYATGGTYIISFSGTCSQIGLSGALGVISWNNSLGLKALLNLGEYVPSSLPSTMEQVRFSDGFNTNNFNDSAVLSWNTSNLISLAFMFENCTAFNQPIGVWNTSNVTTMYGAFVGAAAFNQNINSWDTSNVTDMSYVFQDCTAFNQPLNNWDTSNVTRMSGMFSAASAFNQNISSWDTSNVTQMSFMFKDATAFNQPLNTWDVSLVYQDSDGYEFWNMFSGATSFNQPLSDWNTEFIANMNNMFQNATSFNQDISTWCVSSIASLPSNFNTGGILSAPNFPVWGTCP
jgi:surface protein